MFFYSAGPGVRWTLASAAGGLAVWIAAVAALWQWVGAFALGAVLFPPLAGHAAVIGYCIDQDWEGAGWMFAAMVAVHLMRSHAARLTAQFAAGASGAAGSRPRQPGNVVDTVVVETRTDEPSDGPKRISNDAEFK